MSDEPVRRRIVSGRAQAEDADELVSLRPHRLDEFIGQRQVVEGLKIAVAAARQRGDVLDHLLFDGPPGLGKTTLAYIIAEEMGATLHRTSGPALERASDLVGLLTNLERGDILFIDEIHRLARPIEEYLYPAMEDFKIDFVVDKGPYAKTIALEITPFTLIGATTRAGLVAAPLRDRFGIYHHVGFYDQDDLVRIVMRAAQVLGIKLQPDGAQVLAARARGTPRVVNRLLRRVRDYAQVVADGVINAEIAEEALGAAGVDELGLDELDRKYLRALIDFYNGGPAGPNAIAASLGEDAGTLEDVVEPYLLKIGFVIRTQRGRMATGRAYEHLGLKPPPKQPQAEGQAPLPLDLAAGEEETAEE
ncbi:MAG: Holliday junction branch migration DNA helicase RuvB [Armatimonadetes bacterium]|nr:Holliday junction branch migration DNA helicase RuvB [Armatimonadota bacterium]